VEDRDAVALMVRGVRTWTLAALGLGAGIGLGAGMGLGTACSPTQRPAPTGAVISPTVSAADAGVAAAPSIGPAMFVSQEPPGGLGPGASLPIVAARVFAFGDTQFHHLYGKRTFAQSPFADRFSFEVAVRPAALDDGSDLLLEALLVERGARFADYTPVYLGDAADLSCTQEIARFHRVVADAGLPALLTVTSNHDGFFVGNFTSKADLDGQLAITDMPDDWTRACAEPGSTADHRLTKGGAVAALAARLPEAARRGATWSSDGAADPNGYKRAYLYYVSPLGGGDPGARPVWGVFIDTSDYRGFDLQGSQGAGTVGAIAKEQLVTLDRAMFTATDAAGQKPLWLAFMHSPSAGLDAASRRRFFEFLDVHPEIVGVVAAHTHTPDERAVTLPSGRELPELVVGSTTDWPIGARLVEVRIDPRPGARTPAGVVSQRLLVDLDTLCDGIAPLAADALGYTGYRLVRDDVPDVSLSLYDKLAFATGLDDLGRVRVKQTVGAYLVENELVRAWAALYAQAPGGVPKEHQAALTVLLASRFPGGDSIAELWAAMGRDEGLDKWDIWFDPVLAPLVPRVARLVWTFARQRDTVEALRAWRRGDGERQRYFACHAARAAEAESKRPRRQGKLYIP
jgi:hypothetical protein